MIKRAKVNFLSESLNIKLVIILAISVFLPFYITIPVILTSVFLFIKKENMIKTIVETPYIEFYAILAFILLVSPLIYKNYYGFGCGILMIIFFALEFHLNNVITNRVFEKICNICCVMSALCVPVAFFEKYSGLQDRAEAFTINANFYAYIIELVVLVCAYKFIMTKKYLYILCAIANIAALTLTECRSAATAMVIGLLLLLGAMKKKKMIIGLLITVTTVTAAIHFYPVLIPRYSIIDMSITDRFGIWDRAFRDFLEHPLLGRGLLAYYQISGSAYSPHAHNMLLDLLECTGIVGTSVVIFYFGSIISQLIKSFKFGSEHTKARVALCGAVIATTLVHGITDMPIMGFQTGLLFFMFLALRPKPEYVILTQKIHARLKQPVKTGALAFMKKEKQVYGADSKVGSDLRSGIKS